jgi:hypothetical protein
MIPRTAETIPGGKRKTPHSWGASYDWKPHAILELILLHKKIPYFGDPPPILRQPHYSLHFFKTFSENGCFHIHIFIHEVAPSNKP